MVSIVTNLTNLIARSVDGNNGPTLNRLIAWFDDMEGSVSVLKSGNVVRFKLRNGKTYEAVIGEFMGGR